MLTVRRSKIYTTWFGWYSRRQFRKYFHAVRAFVDPRTLAMDRRWPVIFFCNHAYWWDGFWSQLCTEEFFRQNLYIIIDYQQLAKHRFFTRLGAFSIDRDQPRSAVRTLDYAAKCLVQESSRQNALWVFPQGMIEHVDKQPVHFFHGTSSIISRVLRQTGGIYLVSVVSRIEYLSEQRPDLFLSFRAPEHLDHAGFPGPKNLTNRMRDATAEHLSSLKKKILSRDTGDFAVLVRGRRSINRKVERWKSLAGFGNEEGGHEKARNPGSGFEKNSD